jgi:hypothetical protein
MPLFSLRFLAAFALTLPLISDVPGRVQTDAVAADGSPVARIAHAWMYWISDPMPGAFRVYGRDGHLAVARLIPGHSDVELLNLAIEDDGSMAASWTKKSTPAVSGIGLLDGEDNPTASFGTVSFTPISSISLLTIRFGPSAGSRRPSDGLFPPRSI